MVTEYETLLLLFNAFMYKQLVAKNETLILCVEKSFYSRVATKIGGFS